MAESIDVQEISSNLLQIAIVATNHGLFPQAKKINRALISAMPNREEPVMATAYNLIVSGKANEAVELLSMMEDKIDKTTMLYEAITGLALLLSGNAAAAEKMLEKVADGNEELAVNMAKSLLGELKRNSNQPDNAPVF